MFSLEEIASNKPLTREESLAWLKDPKQKQRPFCLCLHQIENKEQRTIFCFVACDEEQEILEAREKIKNDNQKK